MTNITVTKDYIRYSCMGLSYMVVLELLRTLKLVSNCSLIIWDETNGEH